MKNQSRKLGIEIRDLPNRPSIITPEEYEKIFGGSCKHFYDFCDKCDKCCSGLTCEGETVTRKGVCVQN
jgi:hypothetical protein